MSTKKTEYDFIDHMEFFDLKTPHFVTEKKIGSKWVQTYFNRDETHVYKMLSGDLTAKYINKSPRITRIKRVNNYNGTITVTVNYDNGYRNVYTVTEM